MNAKEIENKYKGKIRRKSSVLLLESEAAIALLDDCLHSNVRFLGIEAFRLFEDGGIQPAMEYSNISFGKVEEVNGKLEVTSFERDLREPWNADKNAIENSKTLIKEGTNNGYPWYEISLEDPETEELLFFRLYEAQ